MDPSLDLEPVSLSEAVKFDLLKYRLVFVDGVILHYPIRLGQNVFYLAATDKYRLILSSHLVLGSEKRDYPPPQKDPILPGSNLTITVTLDIQEDDRW